MSAVETDQAPPLAAEAVVKNPLFSFLLQPLPEYAETCHVEQIFSREEVARIIATTEHIPVEDATLGIDRAIDVTHRRSRVRWVNLSADTMWIFQRLADVIWNVNKVRYQFDLTGLHEGLQIAEYGPGAFFNWHKDHGPGVHTTRKLSITVQLSDESDYEGGTMEFLHGPKIEPAAKSLGTAIIFPSYIMHRVNEVTAGTRRSMVAWVSGPPYR